MRWPKRHPAYSTDTSKVKMTTPYERAAGVWDNRIGSARVQARNWRLVALLALMVAVTAIGGLIYSHNHRPFHVHVVEINPKGEPGRIVLTDQSYSPTDAQLGYLLAQLVELVRDRPLDPVVLRKNWEKAYTFLAGDAIVSMNEYAQHNSGLERHAGGTGQSFARVAHVTSVLKRSDKEYQIQWVETTYVSGVVSEEQAYTGYFHIALEPPKDEAELFRNPLGVYVVGFQWSRDYSPKVLTTPTISDTE